MLLVPAIMSAGCEPAGDAVEPARQESPAPSKPAAANGSVETKTGAAKSDPAAVKTSACQVQDGKQLDAKPLRALGTEPFWAARIVGRCVTYMTPDDQSGTRVWTRFSGTADNGSWTGALGGKPFVLKTRPAPSCSDGMSDNIYPLAVDLLVAGEQRTGCAGPPTTGR